MKQRPDPSNRAYAGGQCSQASTIMISFPALRFCVSDATEMQTVLTAWPHSGYTTDRLRLLVGDSEAKTAVSRSAILQELDDLIEKAGPEDQLLFYLPGTVRPLATPMYC